MILRNLPGLFAAAASVACLVAPVSAQTVPYPRPRPAHLTAKFAPAPAPLAVAPVAAPPVVAAPAAPPSSIGEIAASSTPVAPPAPVRPAPVQPAPATAPAPEVAAASAPATETVAAPLDLAAPGPAPIEVGPAPGASAANGADAPTEAQTISKVNTYFNGIRTLVGNFTQVGPDGSRADGKFFLQKPGKVRFYYQRPSTTDIIADGKSLVVRDRKLATQDVYPLSQTPLKFLLAANMDLSRDSKVTAVYEEPGLVSVAIEEETTFGGKARILLVFGVENKKTFELKQWTITDAQGLDTTVSLTDLDTSTRPDEKLFAVDYTHDSSERR